MSAILRQFRRAPGRILASVLALALAVGAIGVLAIPTVSEGTLHAAVDRDGLADIVVSTTPLSAEQLAAVAALPGVAFAEGQIDLAATSGDRELRLIGLAADRQMDRIAIVAGRQPVANGDVVTTPDVAAIGDVLDVDGGEYRVVGHGSTLWWSGADALYTDLESLRALASEQGTNRLVITAEHDDADSLRQIADAARRTLAAGGDTFTDFPVYMPDGTTPIDADIRQVSSLIGLLGMVAGLVALVLLASTTNTLITERTREVAVMRALGGRRRPLRRRLRRIALTITAAALVIGLPLGVLISNVIARMVLEKFVGITPDVAIDWRVLAGSVVGMLLGARLVAGRAAARVTKLPLAEALRDREGAPFGRSAVQRWSARIPLGGLFTRLAGRASIRRPGRTVGVVVQIATAVGAAFLIPSLAMSVNDYNEKAFATFHWESQRTARDPGLPFAAAVVDGTGEEAGIYVFGEIEDWEVDAYGLEPDTTMVVPAVAEGRWFRPASREIVVSAGFAERTGIEVGEQLVVELASGPETYDVSGLADDFARSIYLDRQTLASDLGAPGMANVVWSWAATPETRLAVASTTTTAGELAAESSAGRDAIVAIFGAIGVILSGVAALAVVSSMTVSLYERRHELAALQAIGARRRRLRGLLVRELVPLGLIGLAGGFVLGALGTRGIIASFESSNAVDIGVSDAVGSIPLIAAATLCTLAGLALLVVRSAARRPIAVMLRGAA
jgi:putative ABC transport system permease protein